MRKRKRKKRMLIIMIRLMMMFVVITVTKELMRDKTLHGCGRLEMFVFAHVNVCMCVCLSSSYQSMFHAFEARRTHTVASPDETTLDLTHDTTYGIT